MTGCSLLKKVYPRAGETAGPPKMPWNAIELM